MFLVLSFQEASKSWDLNPISPQLSIGVPTFLPTTLIPTRRQTYHSEASHTECSTNAAVVSSLQSADLPSFSHIMNVMNWDVHDRLENGHYEFNYAKIGRSELLTALFRFKDYIEVLSMKHLNALQQILGQC